MATAGDLADAAMRCGFCLRENENMEVPKLLPCKHIHCSRCLDEALDVKKIVECPDCKQPLNELIQNLPDAAVDSPQPQEFCDICKKSKEPAVVYCTEERCKRKFCRKHKEFHDELSGDHQIIDIKDYRQQKRKEENTTCTRHGNLPLMFGCRKCPEIICEECLDEEDGCNGSRHEQVRMKKLYNEAKRAIDELKSKAEGKKDELSALDKESDRTLTQYGDETEEMRTLLHAARDDQINIITKRYADIEAEFTQTRKKTVDKIVQFRDDVVKEELSQLSTSLQRVAASLNNDHMVHLVRKSANTKRELREAIEKSLPSMSVAETAAVKISDAHEDINASISSIRSDIHIGEMMTTIAPAGNLDNHATAFDIVGFSDTGSVHEEPDSGQLPGLLLGNACLSGHKLNQYLPSDSTLGVDPGDFFYDDDLAHLSADEIAVPTVPEDINCTGEFVDAVYHSSVYEIDGPNVAIGAEVDDLGSCSQVHQSYSAAASHEMSPHCKSETSPSLKLQQQRVSGASEFKSMDKMDCRPADPTTEERYIPMLSPSNTPNQGVLKNKSKTRDSSSTDMTQCGDRSSMLQSYGHTVNLEPLPFPFANSRTHTTLRPSGAAANYQMEVSDDPGPPKSSETQAQGGVFAWKRGERSMKSDSKGSGGKTSALGAKKK